jgi:hypothetical protein
VKIIVTGSRGWKDPAPVEAVIAGYVLLAEGAGEQLEVVHGNQRKGLDGLADRIARRWGAKPIPVDAEWKRYGKAAGPKRNQRMLDEHPDAVAVWAFRAHGKSNGTDDTCEKAKAAGYTPYVITGGNHSTDH